MDNRTTAWLAYLTFIGWVIAYIQYSNMQEKSSLVLFHLRQMFGLLVSSAALWVLTNVMAFVPGFWSLQWVLYVGLFLLWLIGILGAINGEEKPVPLLGPLFQQWFAFIR
ncbi:MAG: DUF4870 domain-containing protein [Lacibacter sp.]